MTGAYELVLRFADGHEEVCLTDHLDFFSRDRGLLVVRGRRWRIAAETAPATVGMRARLVCVAIGREHEAAAPAA